ncbi:MAG: hypothetical protein JSS49_04995 [Planctomycetes bacterium]|nr:hypothetical protein [Planctomycetota bacterium]
MLLSQHRFLVGCALALVVSVNAMVWSEDDKPPATRAETLQAQRFELMQSHIAGFKVESDETGFATRFAPKPIFKYSDPARGYVAASVWKLGEQGRPKALIAVELHRAAYSKPSICFEYASLTKSPFTVLADEKRIWSPKGTLYEFMPIPDAPEPESTPQLRLIQMRSFAKRFASNEIVDNETCDLRLLPQPVDRYAPSSAKLADGAIFFFTFGTNPEVVLLIESDGQRWEYAAGRLTGAEKVVLTYDSKLVWSGPPLQSGLDSPFTGSVIPTLIPGLGADGKELPESKSVQP